MHTQQDYKFASEAEASAFAEQQRNHWDPSADVYVHGPFLVDEKKVFKDMSWVTPADPYWKVKVEIYK